MYLFYWKVLPFLHCGLLLAIAAYCPWLIAVYLNNVFLFMGLNLLLCIVRYFTLLTPSYCGLSNCVIGWYCFVSMVDYYCLLRFIASWLLLCIGSKYWVFNWLNLLLFITTYCMLLLLFLLLFISCYCVQFIAIIWTNILWFMGICLLGSIVATFFRFCLTRSVEDVAGEWPGWITTSSGYCYLLLFIGHIGFSWGLLGFITVLFGFIALYLALQIIKDHDQVVLGVYCLLF